MRAFFLAAAVLRSPDAAQRAALAAWCAADPGPILHRGQLVGPALRRSAPLRMIEAAMPMPAKISFAAPTDAARAAELRRVKALATLVLAGTLALFVIAKILLPAHPAFGFVAAFAAAAPIGGLADWYAVVALLRRPLGLPIPHTAIIQGNQHRIADKLGEFIEIHFLESAPIEAKLRQIDFGSFIADWLRDRKRSTDLARFVLHLMPEALQATENSGLMTFITRRVTTQLQSIDL